MFININIICTKNYINNSNDKILTRFAKRFSFFLFLKMAS